MRLPVPLLLLLLVSCPGARPGTTPDHGAESLGLPGAAGAAALVRDGAVAPTIESASPGVDGPGSPWPTMMVVKVLNRGAPMADEAFDRRRVLVGALHAAGARLLAGTDYGIDAAEPGTSLHDELGELVASGLTPLDALRAATTWPAEFLGRVGEIGTVAPGARADLLVVDGDPRQDVSVLRHPRGVLLRGAWLERP